MGNSFSVELSKSKCIKCVLNPISEKSFPLMSLLKIVTLMSTVASKVDPHITHVALFFSLSTLWLRAEENTRQQKYFSVEVAQPLSNP